MNASENKNDMVEMNPEAMENVVGGSNDSNIDNLKPLELTRDVYNYCPNCKMKTLVRYTNTGVGVCSVCGNVF